ncbi:branched-chain amino acid ABC transporter [Asanoa ishikariensis]|uniref:Branched-chain amino acid transport system substrate-binding protein n=1 Tax=Asanoa ishikariensis TaxID=137265 RepID=A0A1H3QSU1_9ACTN|nr:ABC transporter substrate-binding protein [Asanoa ishikariensis]GIF64754.1 branched-chain amino acid ABC transporter [Asanoa ishikariensis]SDZ16121.1 branched-chain amino acid transport system substrate-binding protein [Asanoa ishikariensis]
MAKPAIGRTQLTRRGVLVATAGTLLTAACGSDETNSPGPTTRGSEELIIGASLELTGPGAAHGVLQERALRITVDTLNEEGVPVGNLRRKIKMIYRDNGSRPETAEQQATELIQKEGVHAMLGGVLAETSLAMLTVAQTEQVPFISLGSADNIVTPLTARTYIYKLQPNAKDVVEMMSDLLLARKHNTVGVIYSGGEYGKTGVGALRSKLRSIIKVESELPNTGSNFSSAAEKIVEKNPEAVIIWAQAPDSGAALAALRGASYGGQIIFDPGGVADDTLADKDKQAQASGALAVHPASLAGTSLTDTTMADLDRRDFIYRYIQKHGAFRGFAPYSSDAVRLLANAARLGRSVDRGRIRVYLENLTAEGIAGSYEFTPIAHGGMAADSLAVFEVTSGAWIRIS